MEMPVIIHDPGICPECELSALYLFKKEINCMELRASGMPGNLITDYYEYLYCPSCKSRFGAKKNGMYYRPLYPIAQFIEEWKILNNKEGL